MRRTIARSLCLLATASALVACAVPGVAATNLAHRDAKGANAPSFVRAGTLGIVGGNVTPVVALDVMTGNGTQCNVQTDTNDPHTGLKNLGVAYVPSPLDRGTAWVQTKQFMWAGQYQLYAMISPSYGDVLRDVHAVAAVQASLDSASTLYPPGVAVSKGTGSVSVSIGGSGSGMSGGVGLSVPISPGNSKNTFVTILQPKRWDGQQNEPEKMGVDYTLGYACLAGAEICAGYYSSARAYVSVEPYTLGPTAGQYAVSKCFVMRPDP